MCSKDIKVMRICFSKFSLHFISLAINPFLHPDIQHHADAHTDPVGFIIMQRVDGRLILPEAIQALKMKGTASAASTPNEGWGK